MESDVDYIDDMNTYVTDIPGIASTAIALAVHHGLFDSSYPEISPERALFWLNCGVPGSTPPSATEPIRHSSRCNGIFHVVLRHCDIPVNQPGAAVAFTIGTSLAGDRHLTVSCDEFAEINNAHSLFAGT